MLHYADLSRKARNLMAESTTFLPLENFTPEARRATRVVLTDIDDTLTTNGRLPAVAYAAMERLQDVGCAVVPVTGRPAGWCDQIARMWPVDGVVGENGAFYFHYDAAARKMRRVYAQPDAEREKNRMQLRQLGQVILREVPGAAISADQFAREVDLAIDFCEDVEPLPADEINRIVQLFEAAGATAKISSIHVNGWFGSHDKLTMTKRILHDIFALDADIRNEDAVFIGDSPNDAPMWSFFTNGIGVANALAYRGQIADAPRYVTSQAGGAGFAELADALLAAK